MKYNLSEIEKKVLVRIMEELCVKKPDNLPEYPTITKQGIIRAIHKLESFGLIVFNKEINYWETTREGDKLIQNNSTEFDLAYKEFYKNANH